MIFKSAEWRARKRTNWLRYERKHGRRSHGELTHRCWCTGCLPAGRPLRSAIRKAYLRRLRLEKLKRKLKEKISG